MMNRAYALVLVSCLAFSACSSAGPPPAPGFGGADSAPAIAAASGFQTLHAFGNGKDGASPQGELVESNGTFYGTTSAGGANEKGTMFSMSPAGAVKVLHSFGSGNDGVNPQAAMTLVNGIFYGTTASGGSKSEGSVFKVAKSGAKEAVVHSFAGGKDGSLPRAGLTLLNGVFYGTTQQTGAHSAGTVFTITPSGTYKILHQFAPAKGDGGTPSARLIVVGGTLYGTTQVGGAHGAGTVFSITPSGTEKVLYSFFSGNDGETPYAGLTNVKGTLYGTTAFGGIYGYGTAFKVSTSGGGYLKIHDFAAGSSDGAEPEAGMIYVNGYLYGTTAGGGGAQGDGAVFRMTAGGSVKVLYGFTGGNDGSSPVTGVTFSQGKLYGTAAHGGKYDGGTAFSLTP